MAHTGDIDALIPKAAKQVGIPVDLFARVIKYGERSHKGWQTSPMGAFGPGQLMPGTAKALADKYGINPDDYYGNLLGAAHYLREQLSTFKGNRRLAVAAYNAGPGNVQKYGGIPPFTETQNYVKNIFSGPAPKVGGGSRQPVSETTTSRPRAGQPLQPGGPLEMPDFLSGAFERIAQGGSAVANFNRWMQKESDWTDWAATQKAPPKPQQPAGGPPRGQPGSGPSRAVPPAGGKFKGAIAEAFYDPLGAFDEGSFISPIGGHSDHVHISFKNPKAAIEGIRIAQAMGLSARENPYVEHVDPVHTTGSYHYRTFPGMFGGKKVGMGLDVSGPPDKMAAYYKRMLRWR